MAIEVDQDSLRQAAAALALLPSDLDSVPELDAERCGQSLSGSTIGAALMRAKSSQHPCEETVEGPLQPALRLDGDVGQQLSGQR